MLRLPMTEQTGPSPRIAVRLDRELLDAVDKEARRRHSTRSIIVRQALLSQLRPNRHPARREPEPIS